MVTTLRSIVSVNSSRSCGEPSRWTVRWPWRPPPAQATTAPLAGLATPRRSPLGALAGECVAADGDRSVAELVAEPPGGRLVTIEHGNDRPVGVEPSHRRAPNPPAPPVTTTTLPLTSITCLLARPRWPTAVGGARRRPPALGLVGVPHMPTSSAAPARQASVKSGLERAPQRSLAGRHRRRRVGGDRPRPAFARSRAGRPGSTTWLTIPSWSALAALRRSWRPHQRHAEHGLRRHLAHQADQLVGAHLTDRHVRIEERRRRRGDHDVGVGDEVRRPPPAHAPLTAAITGVLARRCATRSAGAGLSRAPRLLAGASRSRLSCTTSSPVWNAFPLPVLTIARTSRVGVQLQPGSLQLGEHRRVHRVADRPVGRRSATRPLPAAPPPGSRSRSSGSRGARGGGSCRPRCAGRASTQWNAAPAPCRAPGWRGRGVEVGGRRLAADEEARPAPRRGGRRARRPRRRRRRPRPSRSTSSTCCGCTLLPPRLIMSPARPSIQTNPSASIVAMSPVATNPSASVRVLEPGRRVRRADELPVPGIVELDVHTRRGGGRRRRSCRGGRGRRRPSSRSPRRARPGRSCSGSMHRELGGEQLRAWRRRQRRA